MGDLATAASPPAVNTPPRERGIIFSAEMVRAILRGEKTQTRRLVKPQPRYLGRPGAHYLQPMWGTSPPPDPVEFGEKWLWREVGPDYPDDQCDDRRCRQGTPGDRLWVRESWRAWERDGDGLDHIWYRADDERRAIPNTPEACDGVVGRFDRWQSPRFMPRWASRITLEITDLRVQRLQEISEEDAIAEGIVPLPPGAGCWLRDRGPAVNAYAAAWDRINGDIATWSANPWVWVISFRGLP